MKRVLITGAMGLAGTYLATELIDEGYEVYGFDLIKDREDGLSPVFTHTFVGSITNEGDVERTLQEVRPELIFHLAAVLSPKSLPRGATELIDINVHGTLNVLQVLAKSEIKPRILIASSSAVYGNVSKQTIDEDAPIRPANLYGVSKIMTEELGRLYTRMHGLEIIISRAFNNTAPGEKRNLVASEFAAQVAEMERGEKPPVLRAGNIDTVRDFTDTRDVVKAYKLIIEKGESGDVYNVSSGVGKPIRDIIEELYRNSTVKFEVKQEKSLVKSHNTDVSRQIGNPHKLNSVTGWEPEIPFQNTIIDLLNYWRR